MEMLSVRNIAEQCLGENVPLSLREDIFDIGSRINRTTSLRNKLNFIQNMCEPDPRPFYIIAHRINKVDEITPAIDQGANAIECDIVAVGNQLIVYHIPDLDPLHWVNLVDYLQELADIARHRTELALVIFDCKPSVTPQHGPRLLRAIRTHLTRRVAGLSILISVASYDQRDVLASLTERGPLRAHEGVAIDEHNSPTDVANYFDDIGISRCGYGNGTIALLTPLPGSSVPPSIMKAIARKALHQDIKLVYVWTLSSGRSIRNYLRTGVDGIFVNDVPKLAEIFSALESQLNVSLASRGHDPFVASYIPNYVLEVRTGDRANAGTDANLQFRLMGSSGEISTTISASPSGLFEHDDTTYVTMHGQYIGELRGLLVSRDNAGIAPGWFLQSVSVHSLLLSQSVDFRFDEWVPQQGTERWIA